MDKEDLKEKQKRLTKLGWHFGPPFFSSNQPEFVGNKGLIRICGRGDTRLEAKTLCVEAVLQYERGEAKDETERI